MSVDISKATDTRPSKGRLTKLIRWTAGPRRSWTCWRSQFQRPRSRASRGRLESSHSAETFVHSHKNEETLFKSRPNEMRYRTSQIDYELQSRVENESRDDDHDDTTSVLSSNRDEKELRVECSPSVSSRYRLFGVPEGPFWHSPWDSQQKELARTGALTSCRETAMHDERDGHGQTPLHWACIHGCHTEVKDLMDFGVDVGAQCIWMRETALMVTVRLRRVDSMNVLLNYDEVCSRDHLSLQNILGNTALHSALHCCRRDPQQLVELEPLFKCGAKFNLIDTEGRTPLHHAASGRYGLALPLLLESGADPNVKDFHGKTALDVAWEYSALNEIVELLRYGASVSL